MFSNITERFSKIFNKLSHKGRLTENNIKETLREIRQTLLEADVALSVVRDFIHSISKQVIGNSFNNNFTPGQELIKLVKKELIMILGEGNNNLNLSTQPPAIIMIVGLQGQGKTTSIAKLGKKIKKTKKKKVLVVSTDIYRPAAIKQLEILSKTANIDFYPSNTNQSPIEIANTALNFAKLKLYDVLLVDTAGRLHIDKHMMDEISNIQNKINPIETLLVVDAMIGQDAVNIAHKFNNSLSITGFIITKTDSDTRAGIILSMKYITKKPIKFLSTGEKLDEFEIFYPDRIATRILGMGDMLTLIENIESKIDKKNIDKLTKTIKSREKFDYNDLLTQIKQIKKIGNITSILGKLPKTQTIFNNDQNNINEKMLLKMETMIYSMTTTEKKQPELIKGSRKRRISKGSGLSIQEINSLLKQFYNIKKMINTIKKGGINKMMKGINNIVNNRFLKS
ncbi:MAG: signal recognition particle protein [Buchnera aphidicola (Floraphis meitanensis)]